MKGIIKEQHWFQMFLSFSPQLQNVDEGNRNSHSFCWDLDMGQQKALFIKILWVFFQYIFLLFSNTSRNTLFASRMLARQSKIAFQHGFQTSPKLIKEQKKDIGSRKEGVRRNQLSFMLMRNLINHMMKTSTSSSLRKLTLTWAQSHLKLSES